MKGAARLWETLLSALVMAAAVAIAASCFVKADDLSKTAYAQDLALGRVQAAADILSSTDGDLNAVWTFFGCGAGSGVLVVPFDNGMEPVQDGDPDYVLVCDPVATDGYLVTCPVLMARMSDGEEIFGVTASWQKGGQDAFYGYE